MGSVDCAAYMVKELPDRVYVSIPADDPRFAAMRAMLAAVTQRGKNSPVPRMLGEWALLGFLFSTGRIPPGASEMPWSQPTMPTDTTDMGADQRRVAQAAEAFDFE